MKTKITSLLAITLAATTFFSCSNEIETPDNGQMLNPGDAQISIGLGNGATTYSTMTLEKIIKDGSGKLFKTDGSEILMTNPKIATTGGANKFTATVPAGSFTEGEAAKLYLYVNGGTPSTAVTTGTAEAKFAASTVSTVISRELVNGLPAGFGPANINLTSGNISTNTIKLKRAAARVGAVTTSSSITGYTVTLNNVNTTSGAIFTTPVAIAANNAVTRVLDGVTTDMFNTTETVGYVYPSINSTVTVTPTTGTPLTVPFAPKAGKNYTVKITPSGNDGVFNGDVTIEEWNETDGDINADLNTKFAEIKIANTAIGIFKEHPTAKNTVTIEAGKTLDNFDFSDVVNPPTGFQIKTIALVSSYADASPLLITPVAGALVNIVTTSNNTGIEVSQILKITFVSTDGKIESTAFTTVSLPTGSAVISDYIAAISIPFNGRTWMPFGPTGDAAIDQATAKAIYETAGNTNAEKLVAYAYSSEANFRKVQGHFFIATNSTMKCPAGYRIAKVADYTTITGTAVPVRGAGALTPQVDKWLATGVDKNDFTNATLNRITKTPAITGGLGWYSEFVEKSTGTKLPFIGTTYSGTPDTNLGGKLDGFAIFTSELRGGITGSYERIAMFHDGWANNAAVIPTEELNISAAVVRCVVEVK